MVLSDAAGGWDDELHEWYDVTHPPRRLEVPDMVSVRRFDRGLDAPALPYAAIRPPSSRLDISSKYWPKTGTSEGTKGCSAPRTGLPEAWTGETGARILRDPDPQGRSESTIGGLGLEQMVLEHISVGVGLLEAGGPGVEDAADQVGDRGPLPGLGDLARHDALAVAQLVHRLPLA